MNTQDVANRFHELSQKGDWAGIQNELFSEDAVSLEPEWSPNWKVEGLANIRQKGEDFGQMIEETHGGYCNEPIVAGNHFSCAMGMDVTMKERGRVKMDEIAVYEVKDGKIVKEQFFFGQW